MTADNNLLQEAERQKLEQLALRQQPVVQHLLGYCWEMVVRASGYGMLNDIELQKAVDHLRRGQSYGAEIMFEPWDDEMQVSFFDETVHCPFEPMVQALQALHDAYRQPEQAAHEQAPLLTTAQMVDAIQAAHYRSHFLPLEAVLSLPLPLLQGKEALLAFFWYSVGGPVQNRTVSAPYCRTLAEQKQSGSPQSLRFQPVEPRDLGIDLPPNATLGRPTIGGRIPAAEWKQTRGDFYRATDGVLPLYVRLALSPNAAPTEREREVLFNYLEAFHQLAIMALLPAYRALSPDFFAWLDREGIV